MTFIRGKITVQKLRPSLYHSHLLQPLLSGLPVDNVPDGREVLGLAVLVLQVVGVLPGVDTKDGAELANNGVLVGVGLDADVASLHVLHQPCPTGPLDTRERSVELALQLVERAVRLGDLGGKGARWRLAAALGLRSEVLPEESVVCVSTCCMLVFFWLVLESFVSLLTTVEVGERLLGDLSLDVTLVLGLLELLDGGVVGGDIGVVVLGVVQLHDLAADGGLERAVVVWGVLTLVCLCTFLSTIMRRTRQVGQSGLAAGEGDAANGSAHGGRRADGGAQSAGAEEGGGHYDFV